MKRLEYVAALRELADYIESHELPDTIEGYWSHQVNDTFGPMTLFINTRNKRDFGTLCAGLGSFEKVVTDYSTGAEVKLPAGMKVHVSIGREQVCKRVVIGTKIVPAKEEKIIPAEPEHEVEIVKWECPESFIALKEESNAE